VGGSFGFSYDALSRRTQMTQPNSITTNYQYNTLSRLLSVLHQTGSSTIDGEAYTLDAAGNRTAKQDDLAGVTSNYTYDKIYELTQVTQGNNTTESYSYDPVGNRLSSLSIPSYSYNSSNELTSNSNGSYTYDNNGNTLTDASGKSYTWDFEDRLTQATLPNNGGTVTFKYDPFGRRIEKVSLTTTSIFVYDGDNLVETVNGSGGEVASYAQGQNIDEPLAMDRSGTIDYYEQDGLGSVTSLTASNGTIAQSYTYDSFGNQTASSGSLTNFFRYTSREFDPETNLQFSRSRYLDSSIGRFTQEDEIGFQGGVNFYPYVSNSPLNWIDPTGDQEDSVSQSFMAAIRSGNADEIENLLDIARDTLTDDEKELGREAVKRLRTPVRDLIRGSLKRSASYHSELENKTLEEIMNDSCQEAKQMKKLVQQSPRLLGKRLPY
jgi:RHS repeat-associated protein